MSESGGPATDMTEQEHTGTAPNAASPPLARRRRRRRWLVGGAAVVLAVASLVAVMMLRPPVTTLAALDTTVLAPTTIQDSIAATGTVASARTFKVFSSLTYAVDRIDVSVGQVVEKGDILGRLSTTTVDKQIRSKLASIDQASGVSDAAITTAETRYNASRTALVNGTNTAVTSANSAVTSAYSAWLKARKAYDDYDDSLDDGQNAQRLAQRAALDAAANARDSAQYSYDKAAADLASAEAALESAELAVAAAQAVVDAAGPAVTQAQLDALAAAQSAAAAAHNNVAAYTDVAKRAELALEAATSAHDNAEDQYRATRTATNNTLSDLRLAADTAHDAYLRALSSRDAAKASASTEVQLNLDGVRSSEASASNLVGLQDLANLNEDRQATTIKAPMAGTVTAVYATVGANPAGPAFMIEDTEQLIVDSAVKEYDVVTVKPGMAVTIESDATRDAVFEGQITSIAPTSDKDTAGDSITGSDIQFATEVEVTSPDTDLRIGMNVRLNYVLAQQDGVLVVPFDAVYTNSWGSKAVLGAVKSADDTYVLREFPVTTGLANDFSVAISGNGITEGLRVLNTPEKHAAGTTVTING